ncbi:MAG: hypothetical protein RIB86_07390, partial [Imperialibacter sp.]
MNCHEINQLDPVEVLAQFRIYPVKTVGQEAQFRAPYRKDVSPSLSYNLQKKVWIDYGTGYSGKMVDLLMKIYETDSVSDMLSKFNQQFAAQNFSF